MDYLPFQVEECLIFAQSVKHTMLNILKNNFIYNISIEILLTFTHFKTVCTKLTIFFIFPFSNLFSNFMQQSFIFKEGMLIGFFF